MGESTGGELARAPDSAHTGCVPSSADPHALAGKVTAGSTHAPANGDTAVDATTPSDGMPPHNGANGTDVTPVGTAESPAGTETVVASPGDGDAAVDVTMPPGVGASRTDGSSVDPTESRPGAEHVARTVEFERPAADRAMRKLLRVQGPPIPGAVFGAQGFMSRSIAFSAVRCTITYLLVPILTPIVGVLNAVDAPLSIALLTLAFVMSIRSLRRFWLADHARRWAYTGLIAVVWVLLAVGLGTDVARLV